MRQFNISNVFNKGHSNLKKERLSVVSIPLVQLAQNTGYFNICCQENAIEYCAYCRISNGFPAF